MKSVLISIQPKWCELIANGKKTVEVRKTRPKLETPFKVYIYCTKAKERFFHGGIGETLDDLYRMPSGEIKFGYSGELMCCNQPYGKDNFLNGKVIGEFVCDKIIELAPINRADEGIEKQACLSREQIANYLRGKGYGWHISDLVIYDKPKELGEFSTVDNEAVKKCEHRERVYTYINGAFLLGSYVCNKGETDWCTKCKTKPIKRPPQSWCYVEGVRE